MKFRDFLTIDTLRIAYWMIVVICGIVLVRSALLTHAARDPLAQTDLDMNHALTPSDLYTPEIRLLIGHYLTKRVAEGEHITPDMVADRPVLPVLRPMLAVVVDETRREFEAEALSPTDLVQLSVGGQNLGDPGHVVAAPCDDRRCAIVIALDKAPSYSPDALRGAVARKVPQVPAGGGK